MTAERCRVLPPSIALLSTAPRCSRARHAAAATARARPRGDSGRRRPDLRAPTRSLASRPPLNLPLGGGGEKAAPLEKGAAVRSLARVATQEWCHAATGNWAVSRFITDPTCLSPDPVSGVERRQRPLGRKRTPFSSPLETKGEEKSVVTAGLLLFVFAFTVLRLIRRQAGEGGHTRQCGDVS